MKKILVAGPDWDMEFGWMLMRWQGYVRRLSRVYDETVVISKAGWFPIYADFAKKEPTLGEPNCWHRLNVTVDHIEPAKVICEAEVLQNFIPYGKKMGSPYVDVVFHARSCGTGKLGVRNWPVSRWNELVRLLDKKNVKMACIGSEDGAHFIDGTVNCKGLHLSKVMDLLANSRLCAGPSSGPMHLASLCRCPHIVWTEAAAKWHLGNVPRGSNRDRYERVWNPLKTRAIVVDREGWQPSVETVYRYIMSELERIRL